MQGHELFAHDIRQAHGVANPYRIKKHELVNHNVLVIEGPFKGQRGRVTHVNGDIADLEMSTRAKKVNIEISMLINTDAPDKDRDPNAMGPIANIGVDWNNYGPGGMKDDAALDKGG